MAKSQAKKKGRVSRPLLMMIIFTTILIIFILIALLLIPRDRIPRFDIAWRNWQGRQQLEAHGEIGVFDDVIKPGSEGTFEFIIVNDTEDELEFGFTLTEILNTSELAHPFMQYKFEVDGLTVFNDDEWHDPDEMNFRRIRIRPLSEQSWTLKWRWGFEGDNENDTLVGVAGGTLSVHCLVLAEVWYG